MTAPRTVAGLAGRLSGLATEPPTTGARPMVVEAGPVEPVAPELEPVDGELDPGTTGALPPGRAPGEPAELTGADPDEEDREDPSEAEGDVRTVGSAGLSRVVGDESDAGAGEAGLADGDDPDPEDADPVEAPGVGGGGNDKGFAVLDPELSESARERCSADPELDPDGVADADGLRRMTLEDGVSPPMLVAAVPEVSGVSVTGRAEPWVGWVAAPAAPDFACVSVIDQSCSVMWWVGQSIRSV